MGVWYFPSLWVNVPKMHGYRHEELAIRPISPYSKISHPIDFLLRGKRENDRGELHFILVWYQTNTILTWCFVINPTSIQNPAAFIWCLAWSKFLGRFSRIRASHPNVPSLSIWKAIEKDYIFFSPGCTLSIHGKIQSMPWHLTKREGPEYTFRYLHCCGPDSAWNNTGTQMFSIAIQLYISSPSHKKYWFTHKCFMKTYKIEKWINLKCLV